VNIGENKTEIEEKGIFRTFSHGLITQKGLTATQQRTQENTGKQQHRKYYKNLDMANFVHQTVTEIRETRHVQAPEDLNDITSSRECYLQIRSMNIVAQQETQENKGVVNKSIQHLHDESTRMDSRLIELCGESYEDIVNGTEEEREELFNRRDYPVVQENDDSMEEDEVVVQKVTKTGDEGRARRSYKDIAEKENKTIRMRMSFKGKQTKIGKKERAQEIRRICTELLKGISHFNANAKITTWKEIGPEVGIRDLDILSDDTIVKMIDTPRNGPLKGEVHSIGIRIVTQLSPDECTRNWNKYRWKSSTLNLIRLREAESQTKDKAFAIGYIQGTSPNGDYLTMKKEINDITGKKAEASWQMLNIPNVSPRMWTVAKNEAQKAAGNSNGPDFKRKKFALSPEGLAVYVTKYEDIKPTKKILIDKYGKRTAFQDGSVARFIPYVHGKVKNRNVIDEKLFTIVKTHCMTKAAEISIPIDLLDIYDRKEYLGGKSIEQIIHEIKNDKGERIFNHIGHRWSTDYNSKKYIVTASESKVDEAQKMVPEIKMLLHGQSNPPDKIFAHFQDPQKGITESDELKRRRSDTMQEDEDAQTYYDREDKCGEQERKKLPEYVMHIVMEDKENDDASSMGFSVATKSIGSNRRGILKRSNVGNSEDEDSLDSTNTAFTHKTGFTNRSVTFDVPQGTENIEDALAKKGIHKERFNAWKSNNINDYNMILKLHSTTKNRVIGIRKLLSTWTGTAAADNPRQDT
jgi:hypothetical protein